MPLAPLRPHRVTDGKQKKANKKLCRQGETASVRTWRHHAWPRRSAKTQARACTWGANARPPAFGLRFAYGMVLGDAATIGSAHRVRQSAHPDPAGKEKKKPPATEVLKEDTVRMVRAPQKDRPQVSFEVGTKWLVAANVVDSRIGKMHADTTGGSCGTESAIKCRRCCPLWKERACKTQIMKLQFLRHAPPQLSGKRVAAFHQPHRQNRRRR